MSEKPSNPKDAVGIRKAPLSVIPMNVIVEMGVGMLEGTVKYGRHNYRGVGVRSSVYFDAAMRHLIAYWEGEDIDPDTMDHDAAGNPIPGTGLSHIAKALCSLAVWRDAQMQGKCEDDRPPRSTPFYPGLNSRAAAIVDKHKDKSPKHWTIKDSGWEPDTERNKREGILRGAPIKEHTLGDYIKGLQGRPVAQNYKRIDGEGSGHVD